MKKLLFAIAALFMGFAATAQNVFFEDFSNCTQDASSQYGYVFLLPDGWSSIKSDNLSNYANVDYFSDAFRPVNFTSGMAVCCITKSSTGAAVDRWLISPEITIEAGNVLEFTAAGGGAANPEILSVYAAAGTTVDDFLAGTCLMDHQTVATTTDYTYHAISLADLEGQTVRFAFRNTTADEWLFRMNLVRVYTPVANEVALTAVNVSPKMAAINSNITLTGTLENNGADNLTSLTLTYTVDGGEPVVETLSGLNVPMHGTYTFTASTPINLATEGSHTVVVTLSNPNGEADNEADNTLSTTFRTYDAANAVERTCLFEEFSTAQCPNCPSGHVRIHDALATRHDRVIVVTHHDGYYTDAMTVADNTTLTWFFNSAVNGGTYAPAAMLDRRPFDFCDEQSPVFFPGNDVGAYMDEAMAVPAFASVNITDLNFNDATRELTMTVSGSLNTTLSNPRLSVYIVQDSILEAQSGAAYNPAQQVGTKYRHMDVMRASILEGTWGKPIQQGAFSEQVSYTMPEKIGNINFNAWRCRVVAFVSNYNSSDLTDCAVENATMSENIQAAYRGAGIENAQVEMALYPNPATDYVVLSCNDQLQEVTVVNTLGQVVYANNSVNGNELVVSTTDFAAGLYIATVKTQNGVSTQRFTVAR